MSVIYAPVVYANADSGLQMSVIYAKVVFKVFKTVLETR